MSFFSSTKPFVRLLSKGIYRHSTSAIAVIDHVANAANSYESISKIIAVTGLCSRRSAEKLVRDNRVCINGNVCTSSAFKYDLTSQPQITIDGVLLRAKYNHQKVRIWALNKGCNELVDMEDRGKERLLVIDRLKISLPSTEFKTPGSLKPIYRLDFNTEGLCLFTNSGLLAKLLNSNEASLARHFRVRVHGLISESKLHGLRRGLFIDGKKFQPMDVSVQNTSGTITWLAITLYENKSRIIQLSFQKLFLNVTRIICVGFGPYKLSECVSSKMAVAEIALTPELNAMYMKSLSGMHKANC